MGAAVRRFSDGRAMVRVSGRVADMLEAEINFGEWDEEELLRGQRRDKNGKFTGRKPLMVPRELYGEWARRQMEAGFQDMVGDLREVVKAVRHIATDASVDETTRLRAAEMVLDRIYGKPKQAVDIGISEPEKHQQVIEAVTVQRDLADDTDADGEVIDAEVVEDDEEEFVFDDDDEFTDAGREQAWRD